MRTLRHLGRFIFFFPGFVLGGIWCGRAFHRDFWSFTLLLFIAIILGHLDDI